MTRRRAYTLAAAACAVPRLVVLLHERGAITAAFTEKSDTFAQTFVHTGTFGFIPGEPSAYTQPLYGWFLVPVYWIFGHGWGAVGLAQIALACVAVVLEYEIARRIVPPAWAVAAAVATTLQPYLVWHDVHVNREIVDQVCAAGLVLATLALAERRSKTLGAVVGVLGGLAMLGNTRLVFLPLVLGAYLLWRRVPLVAVLISLVAAGVTVTPWLVRNKADVGCWAITTDGRALWKANNPQTYPLLSSGRWIDNVSQTSPRPPAPNRLTPEEAWGRWVSSHGRVRPRLDECAQMSFYEHLAWVYVRDHPGSKAKLAALSEQLLWQPNVIETGGSSTGTAKQVVEPVYMWIAYALAVVGLVAVRRAFAVLVLMIAAYQSIFAAIFVGATRYRVAWDFLVVALAAAGGRSLWRWTARWR